VSDVTRILDSIQRGDPRAGEELLPLVYEELRKLAAQKLAHEPAGQTLQATALVHEAWLRLSGGEERQWENRRHFFGAAAEAMRRILIDNARRKQAARHGGGQQRLNVEDVDVATPLADDDVLAIDEALTKFAQRDERKAELVKLRYFGGLTIEETAAALGISAATAKRWWEFSRAWLNAQITRSDT
jgi:RNA polymerase sigma factor (TIGR02999 family)